MSRAQSPWLSIGRYGWTIHFPTRREGSLTSSSRLSHYGESWREHLHELTPDALGTDTRAMSPEDLTVFTIAGPIGDPDLPAGQLRRLNAQQTSWRDVQRRGRDRRFGDAGSLDLVALDVYVKILTRFGGRVFNPHTLVQAEQRADGQAERRGARMLR